MKQIARVMTKRWESQGKRTESHETKLERVMAKTEIKCIQSNSEYGKIKVE